MKPDRKIDHLENEGTTNKNHQSKPRKPKSGHGNRVGANSKIIIMKKTILSVVICFTGIAAFSQRTPGSELSVGIEAGQPVNYDFYTYNGIGIGGTLKYAYNFSESAAVTLQSGYISFAGKTADGEKSPSFNQLPVKAGLRYSFGSLYAEPQLGMSFVSQSKESTSAFTYAINIGLLAGDNYDISLRYEHFGKSNDKYDFKDGFIGFRVAYTFPFGSK